MKELQPIYVGTTAMAKVLDITPTKLRQLVRDKKITTLQGGMGVYMFDVDKTIQAYWGYKHEQ